MAYPGNNPTSYRPDMSMQYQGTYYNDQNAIGMMGQGMQGMENMQVGEYAPVHAVMVDGGDQYGVSTVHCDTLEELTWMGNQGGHVTSYYGPDMAKYTSFQVHTPQHEVRQLLSSEHGIFCLLDDKVRLQSRFGLPLWDHKSENIQDLLCMICTEPNKMLVGGHQTKIVELDLTQRQESLQVNADEFGCAIIKLTNRYVCTGDPSGKVNLRDPKSLASEHTLQAHSGTLSDFDVCGNLLITCGFSNRMGSMALDRFLMVYDLRVNRAMAPIQVANIDPMFLRYLPGYTDRLILVSQAGHYQVLETNVLSSASSPVSDIGTHGAMCSTFDISTSAQAVVFGDSGGYIHMFANGHQPVINTYSRATVFADPPPQLHPMNINNVMTPYSMIPMQYNGPTKLVSDWPQNLCQRVYRKPEPINPEMLRNMKMVHNIGYAPNPPDRLPNQVPYKLSNAKTKKSKKPGVPDSPMGRGEDPFLLVPKKYQKVEIKYSGKLGVDDFDFRHYNKTMWAGLEPDIPNAYCNCMVQVLYYVEYLRMTLLNHICEREFCLSCELGFLFHMFDKQNGLVCQASNFLRAFRTIPEASALGLVLSEAEEQSSRVNLPRLIQNWSRFILQQLHTETMERPVAFKVGSVPSTPVKNIVMPLSLVTLAADSSQEATSTDATEGNALESNLDEKKESEPKKEESIIHKMFSVNFVNMFQCRCGNVMSREASASIFNLTYPSGEEDLQRAVLFTEVMQNSILQEQTTQAWCNVCNKYQPHVQSRHLRNIPDILGLNCQLENPRDLEFWRVQQEIMKATNPNAGQVAPPMPASNVRMCRYGKACTRRDCKFGHDPADGKVPDVTAEMHAMLLESQEVPWVPCTCLMKLNADGKLQVHTMETVPDTEIASSTIYDLYATVTHIKDGKTSGHLVSHVHVDKFFHRRKEGITTTQWYLFNDFSIAPIDQKEAHYFDLDWKVPCCLFYMRRDISSQYNMEVQNPITSECLFADASLVTPRRRLVTFTPLSDEELPKEGDLVGLDAEFVSLIQEEAELRSDGTRSTIKPSHMSVARVTCIRGNDGPLFGEPFIDDYISTQEQVVDYLTQFSGIKPGDLDAQMSNKHLTTLKSAYLKLRFLVDQGVLFVGHGLKKDFRVVNVIVPPKQVIDTVNLFHLPRQRMISLKFLAWYFLGINIQSVTHDSIEDSKTALLLYKKYKNMTDEGGEEIFKLKLHEMYDKGRELKWTIPDN